MRFFAAVFLITLISVSIRAQTTANAERNGYLHFEFNVDTAFVQLGMNTPVIHKVANNDTLKVKNGFYHIYLSYPTNQDFYVQQHVRTDSFYTIRHQFDLELTEIDLKSKNASIRYLIDGDFVLLTDHDTKVFRNEKYLGNEFQIVNLNSEKTQFTLENEAFYPYSFSVLKSDKVQFKEFRFYPKQQPFSASLLIPGIAQLKRKDYLKSALIIGTTVGSFALFATAQEAYGSKMADYKALRKAYLAATTEKQALAAGNRMEAYAKNELGPHNLQRNIAFWAFIGALGYDIFDKIQATKKLNKRKVKDIEWYLRPEFEQYISVGAKLKF